MSHGFARSLRLLRARAPLARAVALPLLAAPGLAQGVPFALEDGQGRLDVWEVAGDGAAPQHVLSDVRLLPLELVGYARVDALRLDRPALVSDGPGAARVRLPQGGSLYRVAVGAATGLLHVRADGTTHLLGLVSDAAGAPGLLAQVHVAPDGSHAAVASPPAAGGDVLVLDLASDGPELCLTADQAPLAIEAASLRVSAGGAWFVAAGALHRAIDLEGTPAEPVGLDLAPGELVLPELALAAHADVVVAVTELDSGDRRIVYVPTWGPYLPVTLGAGDFATPNYDHPLGPWLAVSPDGETVAFRGKEHAARLFVKEPGSQDAPFQLTAPPTFVNGIDNIGVIGFTKVAVMAFLDDGLLAFFTGDLDSHDGVDKLEAAEMFLADLGGPQGVVVFNLTQTSGEGLPPFEERGDLELSFAVLDPQARRLLHFGDVGELFEDALVCFRVDTVHPGGLTKEPPEPTVEVLLDDFEEPPLLLPAGEHVLVIEQEEDDDEEAHPATLRLLQPAELDLPAVLDLLVTLPEGVAFDRFAAARTRGRAALVTQAAGQGEQVHLVALDTAQLTPLTLPGANTTISATLAFSAQGRLHLGLGLAPAPPRFVSIDFDTGGAGASGFLLRPLKLPAGVGYPLSP